ncbi:DUF7266 family protein [Haloarcula nitratireducens]|uniref:Uncharacterized protein n=1 Tax=Haloarcula nitratireducens TaxID=2487749 RepID=A0AAW4PLL2_9EURY|nr:hypothetical protein [Halomicroarcula nitratireducens]MBX0298255.1 hypothetical protein [Halomicroarcula nitratireducens]
MMDDRAVSIQISHTLSLAITALLISGLLIATGGLVESRQEQAIQSELAVVGERIATNLMTADRLASAGGSTAEVQVMVSLPDRVAGSGYRVTVNSSTAPPQLALTSTDPTVTVTVPFETTTTVDGRTVSGGDVRIVFTPSGTLEVRAA